ncbi:hypothetical protein, partial [Pseudomonas syringae group genomosp. 7]|uniref:hypothetical protein n=1 Tax=Pseudomonas syringae group genomosp. 7 TaxID=251699 RepID=UPI00376FB63E
QRMSPFNRGSGAPERGRKTHPARNLPSMRPTSKRLRNIPVCWRLRGEGYAASTGLITGLFT